MAKIPAFKTLDEAVAFWESHDTANYWEEMEEVNFEVELHKNLLHPHLIVLTHRPDHCPGTQQDFEDIVIEYSKPVKPDPRRKFSFFPMD